MREKIGLPVDILDLTVWDALSQVPMDVKKLEFSGLKVIFPESSEVGANRREYVCGSWGLHKLSVPIYLERSCNLCRFQPSSSGIHKGSYCNLSSRHVHSQSIDRWVRMAMC